MLYRFVIELSDVDRSIYKSLDFRVAQHPSETTPYLLSRILAYALSFEEGLEFSGAGLSDPEVPALSSVGQHGAVQLWIEIGNPSARKLHKACKTARIVQVYTYKNPEVLIADIINNDVHRAGEIEIFAFDPQFLTSLEKHLTKNNRWSLLQQQGSIDINTGKQNLNTEIKKYSAKK